MRDKHGHELSFDAPGVVVTAHRKAVRVTNESVHRLARQVATVMGTSMTAAIEIALREKLALLDTDRAKGAAAVPLKQTLTQSSQIES